MISLEKHGVKESLDTLLPIQLLASYNTELHVSSFISVLRK